MLAVAGGVSTTCLPFFALAGVAALTGVTGTTGTTGTTGVIVDEVVRDMGRDPGRDFDSSATALGIAGAVNPGGMVGVERRGWVIK